MHTAAVATDIRLAGDLGKLFGRNHRAFLDSMTPREAFQWLQSQFRDAKKYLAEAHKRGIEFAIFRGKGTHMENLSKEQLFEPAGGTITIIPILKGSKAGGVLQTIVGIVLIVVGAMTSWTGVSGELVVIGIGMVAGGVVQMLSPQPKLNKNADSAQNQPSYVFSGAVNTTAQGNPVPLGYGRMIIGSAVISASRVAADYVPATSGVSTGTPNGSLKKSPYDSEPA